MSAVYCAKWGGVFKNFSNASRYVISGQLSCGMKVVAVVAVVAFVAVVTIVADSAGE
jgi:hypothetical protein